MLQLIAVECRCYSKKSRDNFVFDSSLTRFLLKMIARQMKNAMELCALSVAAV